MASQLRMTTAANTLAFGAALPQVRIAGTPYFITTTARARSAARRTQIGARQSLLFRPCTHRTLGVGAVGARGRPVMTTTPAGASATAAGHQASESSSKTRTHTDIVRGPPGPGERFSDYVVHNGICYVSGQVDREAGDGSVGAQTAGALAKIEGILGRAGTDKSRLLTATIWLADISAAPEMNAVWDAWVERGNLPVRACVQSALVARDMLVEVQVTAAMPLPLPAGVGPPRGVVSTPDAAAAVGPYSQAVRVENGTVYLSGCIGLLAGSSGEFAGPTVEEQTRQCLANMDAVVRASGATRIVKTTILLADMADFGTVNELYKAYFGDGPVPARSCFAAKALPKDALVEIEAIAVTE